MVETVWSRNRSPALTQDPERILNYRVTEDEVRAVVSTEVLRALRRAAIVCTTETREGLRERLDCLPPSRLITKRDGTEVWTRSRGKDRKEVRKTRARLKILWHNRTILNKVLRERIATARARTQAATVARVERAREVVRRRSHEWVLRRRTRILIWVRKPRSVKEVYRNAVVQAQRERQYKNQDPELYAQLLSIIAALRPRVKNARAGSAIQRGNLAPPCK